MLSDPWNTIGIYKVSEIIDRSYLAPKPLRLAMERTSKRFEQEPDDTQCVARR